MLDSTNVDGCKTKRVITTVGVVLDTPVSALSGLGTFWILTEEGFGWKREAEFSVVELKNAALTLAHGGRRTRIREKKRPSRELPAKTLGKACEKRTALFGGLRKLHDSCRLEQQDMRLRKVQELCEGFNHRCGCGCEEVK